jgi:hypothetical protein
MAAVLSCSNRESKPPETMKPLRLPLAVVVNAGRERIAATWRK